MYEMQQWIFWKTRPSPILSDPRKFKLGNERRFSTEELRKTFRAAGVRFFKGGERIL
jgi:hypothetical protein